MKQLVNINDNLKERLVDIGKALSEKNKELLKFEEDIYSLKNFIASKGLYTEYKKIKTSK
jgi:hypothetical protein